MDAAVLFSFNRRYSYCVVFNDGAVPLMSGEVHELECEKCGKAILRRSVDSDDRMCLKCTLETMQKGN